MPPTLKKLLLWGIAVLVILALVALTLFWPERPTHSATQDVWTCSMHPQVRQGKPGQCPICGMDLIPVSELSEQARLAQRAGVETEAITRRELFREVHTVGKLDYNESRVAYISARVNGRVDRLFADFTGIQVKKGDHLVVLYAPSLFITQSAIISDVEALARATPRSPEYLRIKENLEASRQNLRTLGVLPEQIEEIERTKKANLYLTIHAPIGGTVIEKGVRVGQYVKEGDMLYRIADLDPIWLYLDIYEYDLAWVRYGQQVDVTLEAYPGETFKGIVTFIDPFLDDKTRTVKVRVNLKNPDRRLKPAMYATAFIGVRLQPDGTPEPTGLEGKYICPMHPEVVQEKVGSCPICEMQLEKVPEARRPAAEPGHEGHQHEAPAKPPEAKQPSGVLAIRTSAVLDTGKRKIAYRLKDDGAYELVELQLGPRAEGKDDTGQTVSYYPVLKGLKTGDQVVVRGGFLLDSQRQISGMPSLLHPQGQSAASLHAGHGGPAPTTPAPSGSPTGPAHKH